MACKNDNILNTISVTIFDKTSAKDNRSKPATRYNMPPPKYEVKKNNF